LPASTRPVVKQRALQQADNVRPCNTAHTVSDKNAIMDRFKVKVQRSRLQLRQEFFSQSCLSAWNSLPSSVVEALSVNNFKKRLDD